MAKHVPTRSEQIIAGYKFTGHGNCRGCKTQIEWWTTPSGAKIPVDRCPSGSDPWIAHFATCPKADTFRKGR